MGRWGFWTFGPKSATSDGRGWSVRFSVMILTCPDCATSYFVDDDRIPSAGRTVKCSNCGNRWRAEPEPPPPEAGPELPDDAPLEPVPLIETEPQPAPALKSIRKRRPWGLYAGLGGGALLILALAGVVILRQQIVNLAPGVAPAFAAVGLKVDDTGLAIEDITFAPQFQSARPVLLVKGAIRNIRHEARVAPPIRIQLLDVEDEVLGGVVARTTNATIPPGGRRYFAITVSEPPAGIASVTVDFDTSTGASEPRAGAAAPAPPVEAQPVEAQPVGPQPVEATPLTADSPDALAPHDPR